MFGSYKVKLEGELLEKVKKCVEAGGYESVDEFVVRVLEKEIQKVLPPDEGDSASKELVKKRLQGLGYIE
jgi:Arc/MetJ-type ribon-helix-helix transcriptional regulator